MGRSWSSEIPHPVYFNCWCRRIPQQRCLAASDYDNEERNRRILEALSSSEKQDEGGAPTLHKFHKSMERQGLGYGCANTHPQGTGNHTRRNQSQGKKDSPISHRKSWYSGRTVSAPPAVTP